MAASPPTMGKRRVVIGGRAVPMPSGHTLWV